MNKAVTWSVSSDLTLTEDTSLKEFGSALTKAFISMVGCVATMVHAARQAAYASKHMEGGE